MSEGRDRRPRAITDELHRMATGGNFATFSTLLPDGSPAAQVMWVDCDDECVLINTEVERQKYRNVEADTEMRRSIAAGEPPPAPPES